MDTIIIIGHGEYATGITKAVELILGKQENYHAIDYNQDNNASQLKEQLTSLVKRIEGNIIICCDLLNGTPFNKSLELAFQNANIELLYGLNFPMLIELLSQRMFSNSEINLEKVLAVGSAGIGRFDKSIFENSEDDEDEL